MAFQVQVQVQAQEQGLAGADRLLIALPLPANHVAEKATLARPVAVASRLQGIVEPFFTDGGLWGARPRSLPALERVEHHGPAVFDPSTRAWYASANGALVRIETDGRLSVVADDVQGTDVDVRGAAGVAASREPDDTIVVMKLGTDGGGKIVVARGGAFFGPKLSPDGTKVLFSESRAGGGHLWVASVGGGEPVDLGQGYGGAWLPCGKRIVFHRIEHDSLRVTASDLWVMDVARRAATRITSTPDMAEAGPAVSPDWKWMAFFDARTRDVYIVRMPRWEGR
jgi:hypothetical protein